MPRKFVSFLLSSICRRLGEDYESPPGLCCEEVQTSTLTSLAHNPQLGSWLEVRRPILVGDNLSSLGEFVMRFLCGITPKQYHVRLITPIRERVWRIHNAFFVRNEIS